jgi:hypothetical protein
MRRCWARREEGLWQQQPSRRLGKADAQPILETATVADLETDGHALRLLASRQGVTGPAKDATAWAQTRLLGNPKPFPPAPALSGQAIGWRLEPQREAASGRGRVRGYHAPATSKRPSTAAFSACAFSALPTGWNCQTSKCCRESGGVRFSASAVFLTHHAATAF